VVSSSSGIILQREYIQLKNKVQRAQAIAKKDQTLLENGIISAREAMRSAQEAELLEADLQEKKSLLKMMGINVQHNSTQNGGKSIISAPTSGTIVEQTAILGQKIDAMTPIYKIANLSTLWLDIQTPITTARLVNVGDSVRTSLGAYAKVIKIAKGVDPKNQSVIIRAKVTQGGEKLYPGQFVQAAISTPQNQSITVPKSGLIRQNGESFIFVKNSKGFIPKKVHIIKEECTTFVISGDLSGSEDIAITGIVTLKGLLNKLEAAK
jgi:cobalt-zinc-cadmium efflux system membrane fusion protein